MTFPVCWRYLGRCSYLLVALLVMIIAYPFYGGETLGRRLLFGVLTSAILVSGAFAASQRRRTVVMALALAAPALALQWLYTLSGSPILTCFVSCSPPSMRSRLRMSWATCLVPDRSPATSSTRPSPPTS